MKHHRRGKEVLNYGLARAMTPKPNSEAGGMAPNTHDETHRERGRNGPRGPSALLMSAPPWGQGLLHADLPHRPPAESDAGHCGARYPRVQQGPLR